MNRALCGTFGLIGCLVTLAGCADRDPYARTDVWYPTGSNAANLAAMVANPNDLVAGHGNPRQPVTAHIMASERIRNDQPKPLLIPGGSGGGGGSGSGGS